MFNGRFDHAIDPKGRVSIPVRFREVLQRDSLDQLYITNQIFNRERCLALYTPNEWERLVGRIKQKASFDPKVQLFQTFYIGGAYEAQVDGHGRILIPSKLREFARLEREVTFSATAECFQLWDKQTLERVLGEAEKSLSDPEFFKDLGL